MDKQKSFGLFSDFFAFMVLVPLALFAFFVLFLAYRFKWIVGEYFILYFIGVTGIFVLAFLILRKRIKKSMRAKKHNEKI
ncbi:MAG: hypothetical protein HYW50_00345 [Candidatus Diapherotrites archaeon]|nr:hypothetical protein [Candidatus Diapherotrites archaeon]